MKTPLDAKTLHQLKCKWLPKLRCVLPVTVSAMAMTLSAHTWATDQVSVPPTENAKPVIGAHSDCFNLDDQHPYWYPRVPPLVGYAKGERTSAGGDGTCILGFSLDGSKSAVMRIDGKTVHLKPVRSNKAKVIESYASKGNTLTVEVKVTGYASTCVPGEDKCCGDYTYAVISVSRNGLTAKAHVARYSGG